MTAFLSLLLNPRFLAAVGLAAALVGAYVYVDHRAYKRGVDASTLVWQEREAHELAAANLEIDRLNRAARAAEQLQAARVAGIAAQYEKDLQNANRTRDAALAAARAGSLVLRDPGAAPCKDAGGGPGGQAPAAAGGRDGAPGGGLSGQAAEFLLGEAARADEVVRQLTACQAVLLSDRQVTP